MNVNVLPLLWAIPQVRAFERRRFGLPGWKVTLILITAAAVTVHLEKGT